MPAGQRTLVIDPGGNVGYAAAVNIAMHRARELSYAQLLILTQDAKLMPTAAQALQDTLAGDDAAAIAAPLLSFSSRPDVLFSAGGTLGRDGRVSHIGADEPLAKYLDTPTREVAWADGAVLLLDLAAAGEVGGFPEEYFLYVEEVDFALRVRQLGRKVLITSRAVARQEPGNYTPYLYARNTLHFIGKHPDSFPWWARTFASGRLLLRIARRGSAADLRQGVRGLTDAWRGRMGPPPSARRA
ncbi:glycosyltransferase family 2 protein [Blastococcus sp. SYSU DS0828]